MLVWAYHQRVSRLKNVAKKLKIRYGKNKTISVRVKGRLDPIFLVRIKVRDAINRNLKKGEYYDYLNARKLDC